MKVLEINSVCGIRSTGRICTDLAEILENNGHQCMVAYGREVVPEKAKKFAKRIGNESSVKLDGLFTRFFDNAGFNSKKETIAFIKWVEEYNPDVIHLHNLHGYYINIEILFEYLKKSGKPVVWTLHDCWAFTGHCSHFVTAGCEKWKTYCHNCPKKKAYPKSMFVDNSKFNFKKKKELFTSLDNLTIVTPSVWLSDLVKQSFLSKYPVAVINNGIDTDVFKSTTGDFRKKHNLENKKIVLGVASAWGKNKGLFDFYKLADMLSDEYKVVLVGLSDEQLKALPDNILGISRTNNATELAEIYTEAEVFVNTTYCDTYPTVNLEAQACGTPVLTYKTGGSVESVNEDCIVEQGNIDSLYNKIISGVFTLKNDLVFDKKENFLKYLQIFETLNNK